MTSARQDEIQALIDKKQRRLQKLKEKEATLGINTPPEILTEMEDIELEIERLREERRQVQVILCPQRQQLGRRRPIHQRSRPLGKCPLPSSVNTFLI